MEDAVAWAQSILSEPIQTVRPLTGGLTSAMLALTTTSSEYVMRLMTREPWRRHGAELTARERAAQQVLEGTGVPAPRSVALDADGRSTGVAAHLMTRVPGAPAETLTPSQVEAMADLLTRIHAVQPEVPFREYQSWAWEAKWVVPAWTRHPRSWERAFEVLADEAPPYEPTFLHRDFSHRNLLWDGERITGVVDWVETSTGPAGLDAAHAATNLALAFGPEPARQFLSAWSERTGVMPESYWLVMDAAGFRPPPGREPLFGSAAELERLDDWLHGFIAGELP